EKSQPDRLFRNNKQPEDLRRQSLAELETLTGELRREIVKVVARNGGHLSSSLGTVELAVALHRVFDTPRDTVLWDVGHQAYAHKILTGRREHFQTLRQFGGCSGFLSRKESPEYDVLGGGHAGTAISAALGLAVAAQRRGSTARTVAVVGDGSLGCGISLEGLNQVDGSGVPLVIILNDNRMSISSNVGALHSYLNRIISGKAYTRFKALAKTMLQRVPEIYHSVRRIEEAAKSVFLPGGVFEELGLRYLGPVNGHSLPDLIRLLEAARDSRRPVIVHVITDKGRGYAPAEESPCEYHGVGPFDPEQGIATGEKMCFSAAFGRTMIELGEKHPELMAITAAMTTGTGLGSFAERFPDRFFDVGIAEEHALVFASGLAAGGFHPVAAIYSTFMQRAFDPIYHDVCIQHLPVIMALDRAGAVEDGPTHHGIYDLAFLRPLPNLTILAPADENELRAMLFAAVKLKTPVAIRYPRGASGHGFDPSLEPEVIVPGKAKVLREGGDLALWSCGPDCDTALAAAELLEKNYGLRATVVNARSIKPLDTELARELAGRMPIFSLEDHVVTGGLGSAIDEALGAGVRVRHKFGWPDEVLGHGPVKELRRVHGLTAEAIAATIAHMIRP
ncbi:MAG: 1-deoxy-D-xylulose-5-phosphate synthase, partial [Victivallaceae bacterium]